MWIIDHPKGLVVFDTGNNVAISDGELQEVLGRRATATS